MAATATRTRHNCGGPAFGRRTPGCPRCDELAQGAQPRQQPGRRRGHACPCGAWIPAGDYSPRCRACQIAAHNCADSGCAPVCTAFDW